MCGLDHPWNWPINQIACQGVPGAGDRLHDGARNRPKWRPTPPRSSPRSSMRAGVPAGVYNLVLRRRSRRWHRVVESSRYRHGFVHRVDPRGRRRREERRGDGEAR